MGRWIRTARAGGAASLALLLVLLLIVGSAGGAYAEGSEDRDASAETSLAVPEDARLDELAGGIVDDTVTVFDGEIDMATLQTDALDRLASLDAADYEGPSLALALEFDPDAAFLFVRDRIGFDPYAGLLRGADGTLAARGGNSIDRALLLRKILDLMGVPAQLAFAELTEGQAEELVQRSLLPPVRPLPSATSETQAPLDWDAIVRRAGRDYAYLRAALGERIAHIGTADREAARADVRSHAWVQAFIGTDWIDLDPTMLDAQPGDRLARPSHVIEDVPVDKIASVSISLVAETYDGLSYQSTTVLSETLPAWQAADSQILLSFQPEIPGVGGSVIEALGTAGAFVPHLAVAGTDRAGRPFPVRPGRDIVSGETQGGPQVARLRLDVGIIVPGRDPVVQSRILLDRLSPGGVVETAGPISGLELLALQTDEAGPVDLQPIHHVMVSTGAASPWLNANDRADVISFMNELLVDPEAVSAYDFDGLLWPVTVANQSLVLGAERATLEALEADPRVRAFVAEPRVYIVTMSGTPDLPIVTTDLLHDPVAVLDETGAPAGSAAQAEVWYGALQAAAETEFLKRLMSGFGGGSVESVSTASAAELVAFDDPSDPALVGAPTSLLAAIDAGLVAVVPGEPAAAPGWWTVDLRDGTTRSVGREGRGWGRSASSGRGGKPISTPSRDPNRFKYKPTGRTPAPTCTAANEYTTPIGCVSLPGALAFWGVSAVVTVGFAWAVTMLWQYAIGY
jgi:hypothetical protein